ncbi:MAG: histidinol-phosphatase HisJ family protein [Coriobacteriia bacterium]|nr:histidinol-phosphatase HisJ family protein [Coriobacteriia bacterium]
MRELIDCHVHTARCGHATGSVAEYVAAALAAGVVGMVFTEHLALPKEFDPQQHLSMRPEDLDGYLDDVARVAQKHPTLQIVAGLEADYLPGRIDETIKAVQEARDRHDGVSFVLGSVHFLGDWAFDDPHHVEAWDSVDVDWVWREYFDHWCDAARSGVFDCMAHPDLPKKFGHRPSFDPAEMYAEAARAAAGGGVLIEISTAGLRKPVGELYPAPELLAAFHSAGVGVTVGSDAHDPSEVGFRIDAAYDAAARAGYTEITFPGVRGAWRAIQL